MTAYRLQTILTTMVSGPGTCRPESITVHHWGADGQSHDAVVRYLTARRKVNPTSAHYVVSAGRVTRLAAHTRATWHSGSSRGNATSIGIELRPEATPADYATAAALIRDIRDTEGRILPLLPHHHWKATACPGRWNLARLDALARATIAPPTPRREDTPDMLILVSPAGHCYLAGAGPIAHVPNTRDLANLEAAGIKRAAVSDKLLNSLGVR